MEKLSYMQKNAYLLFLASLWRTNRENAQSPRDRG